MANFKVALLYPLKKLKYSWAAFVVMIIGGFIMLLQGMSGFLVGVGVGILACYFVLFLYKLLK